MPDQLQSIVQRMVEAGEPEENIALVIQHYKPTTPAPQAAAAPVSGKPKRPDEFQVLGDLVVGAAKELGSQAERGGEWLRQHVPGVAWLDDKIGHVDLPVDLKPANDAQKFGGQAFQAYEFIAPGMASEKLIGQAAERAPRIVRGIAQMAGQAATAAPIAALQGQDPVAAGTVAALAPPVLKVAGGVAKGTARAVVGAVEGAREGGLGGAIVGGIRNVAPLPAKALLTSAIKPRSVAVAGWDKALDAAMPELKQAEAELGRPIASVKDLMAAIKSAKTRLWAQYSALRPGYAVELDLSRVAEAGRGSIPQKLRLENPARAAAIERELEGYRRTFSLSEAEQLLLETNAELEAFYAKYPQAQRHALLRDPEVARLNAQAKELRDAIYGVLDDAGEGAAARELKRRYGALLQVEDSTYRRALVAARQQPESLSEQIGVVRAAGEYAKGAWRLSHGDPSGAANIAAAYAGRDAARFLKEQQTTDALIRRAFGTFKGGPVPVPMPPKAEIRGLLQQGARPMGAPPAAPDPSYVRGVPAQYGARVVRGDLPPGQSPAGLLPAGDPVTVLPSSGQVMDIPHNIPPDPSGVTAVEGRFGYPSPIVTPPPPTPAGLLPERTATTPRRYPQSDIGGNRPVGPFNLPGPAEAAPTPTAPTPSTPRRPRGKPRGNTAPPAQGSAVDLPANEYATRAEAAYRAGHQGSMPSRFALVTNTAAEQYPVGQINESAPASLRGHKIQWFDSYYDAAKAQHAQLAARSRAATPPSRSVTPAAVKPAPPSAKVQTPAAAAAEVKAQAERMVDLSGAKSAKEVQWRVMSTLQNELVDLRKTGAHGFQSVEWRPGKAYGGKEGWILVDGNPVLSVDKYGATKWADEASAYTKQGGGYVPAKPSSRPAIDRVDSDMPPGERGRVLTARVAKAIGKGGVLRIQVPGDGTFTIDRNPVAIEELMARIKRGGVEMWGSLGEAPSAKAQTLLGHELVSGHSEGLSQP